jgi:hypothetical protein
MGGGIIPKMQGQTQLSLGPYFGNALPRALPYTFNAQVQQGGVPALYLLT